MLLRLRFRWQFNRLPAGTAQIEIPLGELPDNNSLVLQYLRIEQQLLPDIGGGPAVADDVVNRALQGQAVQVMPMMKLGLTQLK